jgi:hypothetical protein
MMMSSVQPIIDRTRWHMRKVFDRMIRIPAPAILLAVLFGFFSCSLFDGNDRIDAEGFASAFMQSFYIEHSAGVIDTASEPLVPSIGRTSPVPKPLFPYMDSIPVHLCFPHIGGRNHPCRLP